MITDEIAKLREQLSTAEHVAACESVRADRATQRAEAAEAKLKALDEQPPSWYEHTLTDEVGYTTSIAEKTANNPFGVAGVNYDKSFTYTCRKLYAKPVPPADVQGAINAFETVRDLHIKTSSELVSSRMRIAELETANALYESDAERIWSMMPELRDTDAHYELHEAVQQRIAELERKLAALLNNKGEQDDTRAKRIV